MWILSTTLPGLNLLRVKPMAEKNPGSFLRLPGSLLCPVKAHAGSVVAPEKTLGLNCNLLHRLPDIAAKLHRTAKTVNTQTTNSSLAVS
jgi:hypothetical protein